jgi:hypothetical protein
LGIKPKFPFFGKIFRNNTFSSTTRYMKNISLIWLGLFFCLASLSAKPTGTGVLANASFTASQTTICIGDSVTVTANDLNLNSYTWKVDGTAFNTTSQAGLRAFSDQAPTPSP